MAPVTADREHPRRTGRSWLTLLTGILVALIGAALTIGGIQLVSLGSTWYYLLAGLGLLGSGILYAMGRREGWWLYALVFAATFLWALVAVGLDGWKLMPRLLAPAILLVWVSLPFVARGLTKGRADRWRTARWSGVGAGVATIVLVFAAGWWITHVRYDRFGEVAAAMPSSPVGTQVPAGEWRFYGRDQAGTRFSPLSQITRENVGNLELAWRFDTGDMPRPGENNATKNTEFNFEATPIKVGDSVYLCTPHRQVIALDPVTGRQKWRFVPDNDTSANQYLSCRGVAYAEDGAAGACARRIISTTADARLFALDADTGRLCAGFGENGYVSLRSQVGPTPPGFHFISSQPMVAGGRIILGGWVADNISEGETSGVVRAYDVTTGALAWAWDLGRSPANAPLRAGEHYTLGTPNAWGSYTADEGLGLVYLPLGNPTPDYFDAKRRPFDNEYNSSIVALDIATGAERWHYQTVHRDVWDFDLPIGPSLVNLPDGRGGVVPALIQSTKRGAFFVLDRRTGRPLVKTVERPVPRTNVPGETLSPTQPYPVGFPSLTPADLGADEVWGATPIDQMLCRIDFARRRYDGQFTPPTLGAGNIGYPAFDGVVDWHGATFDISRHLLIANASYMPFTYQLKRHDEAIRDGNIQPWAGPASGQKMPPSEPGWNPQHGTPYAVKVVPWLNGLQIPCNAPPWGTMVAIDYVTRQIKWTRPVGTTRDLGPFGTHVDLPLPVGMFNIGGNIATAGGLIFVGAYADDYIRALDTRTGEIVWRARLPAGGQATPASYRGRDGRQYVIIAAGGHGGLRTRAGDSVMAYALPRR